MLIEELAQVFADEADQEAALLFLNWFRQLRRHDRIPEADFQELEHVYQDVKEVKSMLLKAIEQEHQQWLDEGREEGLLEGLRKAVAFALDLKFGTTGNRLAEEASRIHDTRLLQELMEVIKQAARPESISEFLRARQVSLTN